MRWIKSWGRALNEWSIEEEELIEEIMRGNTGRVMELLDGGVAIETRDRYDRTPLHLAVDYGRPEIVEELIKRGAEANTENAKGWTPLLSAIEKRSERLVSMLINAGADLEKREPVNFNTPLQFAGIYALAEICKILIDAGADVNAGDWRGIPGVNTIISSLHYHVKIAKDRVSSSDHYRLNEKEQAAMERKIEIIKMLIEAGAKLPKWLDSLDEFKEFFDGDLSWYPGGEKALEKRLRADKIRKKMF